MNSCIDPELLTRLDSRTVSQPRRNDFLVAHARSPYGQDSTPATISNSIASQAQQKKWKRSVMYEVGVFKEQFVERIADLCGKWGGYVFDHPLQVSLSAILVAAFAVVGLIPGIATWLDGAENLYTLPHTQAKNEGILHNTLFSDSLTLPNFVLITSNPPGKNIFTWEHIATAHQIDQIVRGRMVDPIQGRRIALPAVADYLPGVTATTLRQQQRFAASRKYNSSKFGHPTLANGGSSFSNFFMRSLTTSNKGIPLPQAELLSYEMPNAAKGIGKGARGRLNRVPDKVLTYDDICALSPHGKCAINSIFAMNIFEMQKILPPGSPPELYVLNGTIFNLDRKGFVPDYLLGNVKIVKCIREMSTSVLLNFYSPSQLLPGTGPGRNKAEMGCVKSVDAFHMIYELDDRKEFLSRNLAWMELMYDVLSHNRNYGNLLVGANAFKSRDDELRRSTNESQDIIFVIFTFILIISYTAIINFSCDLYKNRAVTALFGSLSTLLGILCGFGYTSLMGVSFVPTALVTPFLVMGVGCDDVFVIINSYALAYCEPTPRDRCVVTFKDCGVSVILTTATNLIAFGVGCQSPYTAIRNFCLFSLNGLAFSLFFELTIFFAILCIDARREVERRSCFFKSAAEDKSGAIQDNKQLASAISSLFGSRRLSTFEMVNYQVGNDWNGKQGFIPKMRDTSNQSSLWQRFIDRGNYLFPSPHERLASEEQALIIASSHPMFVREPQGNVGKQWRQFFSTVFCVILLHPAVKVIVMIVFLGIAIAAFHGIRSVEQGLELKDLSPDTSYLKVYDQLYDMFFGRYDIPVYIFFPEPTPWWDPRVLRTVRALDAKLANQKSTRFLNNPLIRMIDDPELAMGLNSADQAIFESSLYEALSSSQSKYKQFEKDFAWEGPHLVSWKLTLLPAGMSTSKERAQWMRDIRDDCRSIGLLGHSNNTSEYHAFFPLKAIAWNYMMLFYESDLQIMSSVISSLTTAAISMFVVALILIPEVTSGLMVIFVMTLIDLAVTGFMYYWKVKLNMISMITLVISIGFSIDYSAHICHTFTHCLGRTRNLRAVECVVLMGTPVFHGAASTIVGIMVLGYSQSFIFRLFFKMMIMVLVFGILHGLILLPVLLSLFGKMPGKPVVEISSHSLAIKSNHKRSHTQPFTASRINTKQGASISAENGQHRRHHSLDVNRLPHLRADSSIWAKPNITSAYSKTIVPQENRKKDVVAIDVSNDHSEYRQRRGFPQADLDDRSQKRFSDQNRLCRQAFGWALPQPLGLQEHFEVEGATATFGRRRRLPEPLERSSIDGRYTPPPTVSVSPTSPLYNAPLVSPAAAASFSSASSSRCIPTAKLLSSMCAPDENVFRTAQGFSAQLKSVPEPDTRKNEFLKQYTSDHKDSSLNEQVMYQHNLYSHLPRSETSERLTYLQSHSPTESLTKDVSRPSNISPRNKTTPLHLSEWAKHLSPISNSVPKSYLRHVPQHGRQQSFTSSVIETGISQSPQQFFNAVTRPNESLGRLSRAGSCPRRQLNLLSETARSPSFVSIALSQASDNQMPSKLSPVVEHNVSSERVVRSQRLLHTDLPTQILDSLERSRLLEDGALRLQATATRHVRRRLQRPHSSPRCKRLYQSNTNLPFLALASAPVTPVNLSQNSERKIYVDTPIFEPKVWDVERCLRSLTHKSTVPVLNPRTPRLVPLHQTQQSLGNTSALN